MQKRWHHYGRFLTRTRKQVTSAFQSWTRCPLVRSHITRCFLNACQCLVSLARLTSFTSTPTHTPTVLVASLPYEQPLLLLQGWTTHGVPVFKTASHPCPLYPIWKIWLELRLVSRKPHGGYWAPYICTADPCPGARAHHLQHRLLQHTITRARALWEAMQQKIVVSVHFL